MRKLACAKRLVRAARNEGNGRLTWHFGKHLWLIHRRGNFQHEHLLVFIRW